jgi:hypothetical protein
VTQKRLGDWYKRQDGRDFLNMNFENPPADLADYGLIRWKESTVPGSRAPHLVDGTLRWENYQRPFSCGFRFEEILSVLLGVGVTTGSFDLGISIAAADGSQVRQLVLRLRPGEDTAKPIVATRGNEEVPLAHEAELSPVPRLGQGPFDIFLAFATTRDAEAEPATELTATIMRKPGTALYVGTSKLPGTDWAKGVLTLWTQSPTRPFTVSLRKVVISGTLARPVDVKPLDMQRLGIEIGDVEPAGGKPVDIKPSDIKEEPWRS